ncbi:MAG: glycosyltransferase family 4 protein [Acidimicrobiales bacterium]
MSGRWLVLGSHIPAEGRLGGMIRYTVEVLRALEARPDVDVEVHCQLGAVPFLADELGIAVDRLHPGATGSTVRDSLIERRGLAWLVERRRPDVVFGTKQLVPRRVGDELQVLTVHDLLPFDRPCDFGLAKRFLLPPFYRRSLEEADLLACVSAATRDRLLYHLPSIDRRVVVVPNAMTSTLRSVETEPIAELADRRFALVVGDRSRRKNLGFVVDLWPEVMARQPDAHLAVVGPPGWGRNERLPGLVDLVRSGSASTHELIPDGQLRWAYERSAVTLCPSLLEGFGLPVLEALSFGCPVVISTDPAQAEVAGRRGAAIPVDRPADWVASILDHLRGSRPTVEPLPERGWAEVAAELVAAVEHRSSMVARGRPTVARPRRV